MNWRLKGLCAFWKCSGAPIGDRNNDNQRSIDLKLMFAIKEVIQDMAGIAKSSSRLLAYGIFISRVIDHLGIDTYDVDKIIVNSREH
ncbi:hypothetical protein Lal_00039697, partial [Lupinus albus]